MYNKEKRSLIKSISFFEIFLLISFSFSIAFILQDNLVNAASHIAGTISIGPDTFEIQSKGLSQVTDKGIPTESITVKEFFTGDIGSRITGIDPSDAK
jgi:hypothetical protein